MKTLQQFTVLAAILLSSIGQAQNESFAMITKKYDEAIKADNKGVGILIKKEGKIETLSLGNFNLSENDVFNIGSGTKTFTAVLIMQEVERGNLKLSDPISNYLTPIQNVDGSLTVENLLTHESGLDEVAGRNILDVYYAKNDSLYEDQMLYQVEENDPESIGKFSYCNTNYLLLGKIIEKVNDKPYFDVLEERIFEPLKMNDSYPYVSKSIANLATPMFQGEDATDYLDYRFFANVAFSAGCIASTLSDMEIFYTALFETEKLLSKKSVSSMIENGSDSYGYGLFKSEYSDELHIGHGGNNIGYSFASEYNLKTKNLVLMFSNNMSIPSEGLIQSDLITYLSGGIVADFAGVNLDIFGKYSGTYFIKEANMELTVAVEDEKMYLVSEAQGMRSELTQEGDSALRDLDVGVTLTIIPEDEKSLTFSQGGFQTTMSRVD